MNYLPLDPLKYITNTLTIIVLIYMGQSIKIQSVNADQLFNPVDKNAKNIGVAITTINNTKKKQLRLNAGAIYAKLNGYSLVKIPRSLKLLYFDQWPDSFLIVMQ